MKVYVDGEDGGKRLIGRADVPDDGSPAYEVLMFGKASAISERFAIGTVTHMPEGGGEPVVERAILAAPWQLVNMLPGWEPLAS